MTGSVAAGLHGFHASELPYVFGTFDGTPPRWPEVPETPVERAYSNAMIGYWMSFARTGRPVADGAPVWSTYDSQGAYMAFTERPTPSLMPCMYPLQQAVVCRRRASGDEAWNWNRGIISPPLPGPVPGCVGRP